MDGHCDNCGKENSECDCIKCKECGSVNNIEDNDVCADCNTEHQDYIETVRTRN